MILTCPNCATRFMISAQALAPEGRKVKCSKCDEIWHQTPDPDELIDNLEKAIEDIPESVKPVPEGSSVPAIREDEQDAHTNAPTNKRTIITSLAAAALVFVLIMGVLMAIKTPLTQSWPASIAVYNALGIAAPAPGQGIEFDRIYAEINKDGHVIIEGLLLNLTATAQPIPTLHATIKDRDGKDLASWRITPPQKTLNGEDTVPFKAHYTEKLTNADSVQLKFTLTGANAQADIAPITDTHTDHNDNEKHSPVHDAHSAADKKHAQPHHTPANDAGHH